MKMVIEGNQRTVELLLKASMDRGTSEAERLDQEDQRIKVVELDERRKVKKKMEKESLW